MPRSVEINALRRGFISRMLPFKRGKNGADRIKMRWSLLIIWGFVAASVGWTAISSTTYLLIKHKAGYKEVRFSHILLLPIRLDEYRKAKGEFWIREGMDW
jgi:hypothetical protein